MAPNRTDAAGASQKQARRTLPRIVPAVPLALSRAPPSTRPITPEESNTGPVTQQEPEAQPAVKEPEEQPPAAVQAPLTPESKASGAKDGDSEEAIVANSPPDAQDGHVEESLDSRVSGASGQENNSSHDSALAQSEPKIASVNSERAKLVAPAQLPPPFYPSQKPVTHAPMNGSAELSFCPSSTHRSSHRPQPSVEGIVFGAAQESPAMPSTPHEVETDMTGPHQPFTRPPPGFAPPQFAPPFYPGHSHHPSDATAPWLYPAYSMAPPETLYTDGRDFHAHSFSAVPAMYQPSYQDQISSQAAPIAVNGGTRSHSQSPSKSQFSEEEEARRAPYQNGVMPQGAERIAESPFELAAYLSAQLGNPEFADFILQVRAEEGILLSMPVHGIVVARSPVVAEAIRRSVPSAHGSRDSRRLIDILTPDKFITSESLNEAIKLLYGAPVLSVQSFLYGLGPPSNDGEQDATCNEARRRMDQALSYAAAGKVLQLPSMQARGIEIAKALLRWDTLEQALHFGLEESNSPVNHGGDASERILVDTHAMTLLSGIVDFAAYNFPVNFSLYTIAPELRHDPRLPSLVEFRPPTHNPRLSKIRFGDAPPQDDSNPSYITRTLSSVLVSLPLPLLERLFNHRATANQLGWTGVVQTMRNVIGERESRRQKALRGQIKPSHDGTVPRPLLENLYLEERVEPSHAHPSGHKLISAPMAD